MGKVWSELVELIRRHPALWLPVLVADLLGYFANLGRNGLLRVIVVHQSTQHSALGGAVVHTSLSPAEVRSATVIALLLSWVVYFLRILLYSAAFMTTATMVRSYLQRKSKPAREIAPTLGRNWGGTLELALRGLAVYAVAALLFSWMTPLLVNHGQTALLHNPVFGYVLTLLVLAVLALVLPPVALRVLTGRVPSRETVRLAQVLAITLVVVASLLSTFIAGSSREMAHVPLGARYPLEAIGSLLAALPYVLLFTGTALLAWRTDEAEPEV